MAMMEKHFRIVDGEGVTTEVGPDFDGTGRICIAQGITAIFLTAPEALMVADAIRELTRPTKVDTSHAILYPPGVR